VRGARSQTLHQLQTIGDHHRWILAGAAVQRLVLIGDRFAIEHGCGNAPFEQTAQRGAFAHEQGFRRRNYPQHHSEAGGGLLVGHRQALGAALENALDDGRLPALRH
jgi:hypothetical protein